MKFGVTSDIHFGAKSSRFLLDGDYTNFKRAVEIFNRCQRVYFNGDILDVALNLATPKRNYIPQNSDEEKMIRNRTKLLLPNLELLLDACPNPDFVYLKGNHDGYDVFFEELTSFAHKFNGRLKLSDGPEIIGNSFIYHGDDLIDDLQYKKNLKGKTWEERVETEGTPLKLEIEMYSKILAKLQERYDLTDIEHIFLGHFHVERPMLTIPDKNVSFHNSGAFTLPYNAIIFECDTIEKESDALGYLQAHQFVHSPTQGKR